MRTWIGAALGIAMLALGGISANAQQPYPNKPITVIVPFAPGGNTDVIGRIVLEHMATTLGQPMIVENVGGAGGSTGSLRASRAAPDGYTLLVGQMGTHGAAPALYPNLGYDPVNDFAHVSQLTDTPIGIFVRKGLPAQTLAEFVTLLKAAPDKLNNGHGGVGATSHISCLYLTAIIGARSPMVPYRGSGPALQDLIAGTHDFMCDQIPHTVPHVKAGTVRMLAIAMPSRADVLPDVPTTTEAGLPQFQASGWNALFAPKGTPEPIVRRLAEAAEAALQDAGVRKKLDDLGAIVPARRGPAALRALVASEVEKWTPVIRAAKVIAN